MLIKYEEEYGQIFKRLMILEITIRNRLLYATEKIIGNNTYDTYRNFFINPYIYKQYDTKYKGNRLQQIIKCREISNNHDKFIKLIHSLYLSHLLDFILTNKQFYTNSEILNLFYDIKPQNKQEFEKFKKKRMLIQQLRNDIMHFNFESYEQNKEEYIEALCLFESHIGCHISDSILS